MKITPWFGQSLFLNGIFLAALSLQSSGTHYSCAYAEILPDIEAHRFKVIPLEKSKTGRVYRFRTDLAELPHTGNIVLIEAGGKPIMAFRVLKSDSETGEFIGKRVRRYDTVSELKLNERYGSAEKLADLVSPPPPETALYNPNAKPEMGLSSPQSPLPPKSNAKPELDPLPSVGLPAPEVSLPQPAPTPKTVKGKLDVDAYDDDLDSSTSPQNLNKGSITSPGTNADGNNQEDGVDRDRITEIKNDLEVDETVALNPYSHLIGISLGAFRNLSNFSLPESSQHNGFTVYFSHELEQGIYTRGKRPQDALSLEYGITYYDRLNADAPNDEFTLLPLRAEIRYDLHFSESFTALASVGLQYNLIMATQNVTSSPADQQKTHSLQGFQPNLSAGFLYNIGPQWYLRGDLGLDRFAFGLAVKW